MAGEIQSSDKYYASKKPLAFRSTQEGRKNPPPAPSYKQKSSDTTTSSDKYYTEMETPGQPAAGRAKEDSVMALNVSEKLLSEIISAFGRKVTRIHVQGTAEDIVKSRVTVDMAVGRNVLTRDQSDRISFLSVDPETYSAKLEEPNTSEIDELTKVNEPDKVEEDTVPAEDHEPVAEWDAEDANSAAEKKEAAKTTSKVKRKATKKKPTKKKPTKKTAAKAKAKSADPADSDLDDILNPPVETKDDPDQGKPWVEEDVETKDDPDQGKSDWDEEDIAKAMSVKYDNPGDDTEVESFDADSDD